LELVYLWVEDYKNIKKQGFNFLPKFNCHYDGETLIIDKKNEDEYIKNFFGNNINITAIVGKNGSGKSNIVKSIVDDNTMDSSVDIYGMRFLLYYDGFNFFIQLKDMNNENYNFNIINKISKNKILIKDINVDNNVFDKFYFKNYRLFIDNISSKKSYLIENHYNQAICEFQGKDKESYNIQLIINLLQNKKIKIPFYPPRKLIISLSTFQDEFLEEINKIISLDKIDVKSIKNNHDFLIKIEFYFLFLYSLGYSKYDILGELPNTKPPIPSEWNNISFQNIEEINKIVRANIPKEYLSKIDSILEQLKIEHSVIDTYIVNTITIDIDKISSEFILNYQQISSKEDLFTFDFFPYPSSGEYNFLLTFAKIFKCLSSLNNKNIFIIIDEGELTLHPKWQKNYINLIIAFLRSNFKNFKFHIIFTTHSPFLLSDIPKENIIFLDKKKNGDCKVLNHDEVLSKKQTFGANIHTLLSDSFFMEDGLMGEFAKSKINEIIDFYKIVQKKQHINCLKKIYLAKRKDMFWQTQSIIGEEYLKQVIKNHLVEIEKILLRKDGAKKEEIKRVEAYLESLKK